MISAISILNFLSHKDTHLEFSPGVNIIVGPTDSGKSAIIKALKWVIHNRPLGDGMKSSWGGDTGVSVIVDGKSVDRVKNSKNSYFIDDLRFDAVKGDVPVEVVKALNLSEINLQTQFDSHFLLSKSSGEVAQYFNKVAHLDKIDTGLQNIQRWSRDVQKKLEYTQQDLESQKERLLSYVSLNEIEGLILALEQKETTCNRQANKRQEVLGLVDAIKSVDEELEEIKFITDLEKSVVNILGIFKKQQAVSLDLIGLTWIIKNIKEVEGMLDEIEAVVNLEEKLDSVLGVIQRQAELQDQVLELKDLLTRLDDLEEGLCSTTNSLSAFEKQFHKELGKGSVCPLCEQVIK